MSNADRHFTSKISHLEALVPRPYLQITFQVFFSLVFVCLYTCIRVCMLSYYTSCCSFAIAFQYTQYKSTDRIHYSVTKNIVSAWKSNRVNLHLRKTWLKLCFLGPLKTFYMNTRSVFFLLYSFYVFFSDKRIIKNKYLVPILVDFELVRGILLEHEKPVRI